MLRAYFILALLHTKDGRLALSLLSHGMVLLLITLSAYRSRLVFQNAVSQPHLLTMRPYPDPHPKHTPPSLLGARL